MNGVVAGLALGVLLGLGGGLPAGRLWERYAYEMIGVRERLGLARGYAGGAFKAVGGVLLVAALAVAAVVWSVRSEADPPAPAPTPPAAERPDR